MQIAFCLFCRYSSNNCECKAFHVSDVFTLFMNFCVNIDFTNRRNVISRQWIETSTIYDENTEKQRFSAR